MIFPQMLPGSRRYSEEGQCWLEHHQDGCRTLYGSRAAADTYTPLAHEWMRWGCFSRRYSSQAPPRRYNASVLARPIIGVPQTRFSQRRPSLIPTGRAAAGVAVGRASAASERSIFQHR